MRAKKTGLITLFSSYSIQNSIFVCYYYPTASAHVEMVVQIYKK
ncbi:hypothetical protein [Anaeromicrobium sp.]|nr:hypothetical protein [Anaeromicrobium sp.]